MASASARTAPVLALLLSLSSAAAFAPSGGLHLPRVSGWSTRAGACDASPLSLRMALSRRDALAIPAVLLLPLVSVSVPRPAFADSTGKFSSKRTAKNRYVPRIKKGLVLLAAVEAGGDPAAFLAAEEDITGALKLYGGAQKKSETPDKISNRLVADAEAFSIAAKGMGKGGDVTLARAAIDSYFSHLPKDGKEPFGTGEAPPAATEQEIEAAAQAGAN